MTATVPKTPFELTGEHADAINALLPTSTYVVGLRENATGSVRFFPHDSEWHEASLWWWSSGNGSCDCNRHLMFHGEFSEDVPCSEQLYTVVGIWFSDGGEIRDLWQMNDF